jgi:hypothetical protein
MTMLRTNLMGDPSTIRRFAMGTMLGGIYIRIPKGGAEKVAL